MSNIKKNDSIKKRKLNGLNLADYPEEYVEAYTYLQERLPENFKKVQMAIICGSGLNNLAKNISGGKEFNYKDIPGFCPSTVVGHLGKLVFGYLSGIPIVCMVGRFHFYEGHSAQRVTFPIRIFKMFGVKLLFLTNAAGSLNEKIHKGDLMIIRDHISFLNFTGANPLIGPNYSVFGERFPSMLNAYSYKLSHSFVKAAQKCNYNKLKEGTYVCSSGPSYETPAEARFFAKFGDVIGMSTAPEVTVASHCGIEVVGISLVTNMVSQDYAISAFKTPEELEAENYKSPTISHSEVVQAGNENSVILEKILETFIQMIKKEGYFENVDQKTMN